MDLLRRVVREVHRRSLWQVLGIYMAGSWGVLQVVDYMTDFAGLPEWTPTMAFLLLLIGLPVTTATAFLQEGVPGMRPDAAFEDEEDVDLLTPDDVEQRPPEHDRHGAAVFTWRNAILGGVGAALLLTVSVAAYFVMWAAGIGPMGSLVAQGVLDERDPVLLAAFENRTGDESLGAVVTDALRVDLLESQVVTLVDGGLVDDALRRMGRLGESLTPDVAREVAVREGIKAVVEGEISRAGSGYLLSARLVNPQDGRAFAAFRQTADGDDQILPAIDELSEQLRTKAGESLRDIRAGEPLEAVTTSSLEALRLFVRADEAEEQGDGGLALDLLEEAVAMDSTFSMAWRKIAVIHSNRGQDRDAQVAAAEAAYRHRNRLTSRERSLTEAYYHYTVTDDQEAVADAYRRVLADHPHDPVALNNLGLYYGDRNDYDAAAELYDRAVNGPGRSGSAFNNLVIARYNQGRKDEAMAVLDAWVERYPYEWRMPRHRTMLLWAAGDLDEAEATALQALEDFSENDFARERLARLHSDLLRAQGRVSEAREFFVEQETEAWAAENRRLAFFAASDVFRLDLIAASSRADTLALIRDLEATFERTMADVPESERPYGNLAYTWAWAGRDADRARTWWSRNTAATPEEERETPEHRRGQRFFEAYLDMTFGEGAEAVEFFRDVRRENPDCVTCLRGELARAHLAMGRPDSAVVHMETLLHHDTFDWTDDRERDLHELLRVLARSYEEIGRTEDAADAWTRFADRWENADAALQPHVRRARAEAARLTGGAAAQ